MSDYYDIKISCTRASLDDDLSDNCQTGIMHISASIVHGSYDADQDEDNEEAVGTVCAYLLDPYSGGDILDEADAESGDLLSAATIIYKRHGRSYELSSSFNSWWDVEMPHGRALYIDRVDVDENYRGKGLALLAMRRLIQVFESNLVVLFAATEGDRGRLENYYSRLGFKKLVSRSKLVRGFACGVMFLDPARMHPKDADWEKSLVKVVSDDHRASMN